MKADATTARPHLQFLDGLRALAALLVIFHHAYLQSWPYAVYPVAKPSGTLGHLINWLAFGKVAVPAFIVLSGFCLMLPVMRSQSLIQPANFFMRRCRRILPPYYAALALALLLDFTILNPHSFTIYDTAFPINLTGILSHLSLTQNFTPNPYQIAGPLWSIAVEFQIYLFFPLFVLVYRKWGVWASLLLTTCFGFGSSIALAKLGLPNTYSHYIAMFGFGMAAAHFAFTLKDKAIRQATRLCYIGIPLIAIVGLGVHRQLGSNMPLTDALMGLFVSAILYLATTHPAGRLTRFLSTRLLAWIGSFSYSIYLVHVPLQQLIWQYVAHAAGMSPTAAFLFISTVGTAAIVAMAYGFYWTFERPYLTSKSSRSKTANGIIPAPGGEIAATETIQVA